MVIQRYLAFSAPALLFLPTFINWIRFFQLQRLSITCGQYLGWSACTPPDWHPTIKVFWYLPNTFYEPTYISAYGSWEKYLGSAVMFIRSHVQHPTNPFYLPWSASIAQSTKHNDKTQRHSDGFTGSEIRYIMKTERLYLKISLACWCRGKAKHQRIKLQLQFGTNERIQRAESLKAQRIPTSLS